VWVPRRLRKRFDPREIQKLMTHRNDCAKAAAARVAEELAEGRLDYADEAFNQVCRPVASGLGHCWVTAVVMLAAAAAARAG
jgi:hypothetical protein